LYLEGRFRFHAGNVGDRVLLHYVMCLRDWCCKCLRRRETPDLEEEGEEEEVPSNTPQEEEEETAPAEEAEQKPVTPPRPNRSKLEAALKEAEECKRQISSVSEDSPEALRRQTVVFRSFQEKEKGRESRKRLRSSPGKLERAKFDSSELQNNTETETERVVITDTHQFVREKPPSGVHQEKVPQTEPSPVIRETDLYTPDSNLQLSVVSLESEDSDLGRPVFELVPVQVHQSSPVDQQHLDLHQQIKTDLDQKTQSKSEQKTQTELNQNTQTELEEIHMKGKRMTSREKQKKGEEPTLREPHKRSPRKSGMSTCSPTRRSGCGAHFVCRPGGGRTGTGGIRRRKSWRTRSLG
jgi:hypothetical protein